MPTGRRIALLLDLNEFYTRTVAIGMRRFFRSHPGWVCEFVNTSHDEQWDWILEGNWDGILTYTYTDSLITFLEKCGIPSINVSNALPPTSQIARVVSDDYLVGKLTAEHFLERGLRRFAFFGNRAYVAMLRRKGFSETVEAAGFRCEELSPAFQMEKSHFMRTELPELEEQIALGLWPVGVFCVNDTYARYVIGCCAAHDIQMPEQVAVVGVNNSEVADGMAEIPFSSVELQLDKIGYTAMELLAEMIDGKPKPKEPILVAPKRVIVRQSSDLLAVEDEAISRTLRLIRENALKPVRIEDIVRKVGLSRRMLEKRFKAATGRSPYAEVSRLRVEKAKLLLSDTDLRISEVAEASGFGHAKQLHAIFTRDAGMPPSVFRKKFHTPR